MFAPAAVHFYIVRMNSFFVCSDGQEGQDSDCKILSSFSESAVDMDSMKLEDGDIKVLTD